MFAADTHRHTCNTNLFDLVCYRPVSYTHLDVYKRQEEACVKYINANTILPDMLVEELQKYVQAGYIYIPDKDRRQSFRV